ncbi:hypothetical protein [Synechococcus phage MinM1]|nr:hypothetical protein [Synechococcus phage MinM1]
MPDAPTLPRAPAAPPILARIRAALRALPATNPVYATDAILLLRDALREAAIHARIGGQHAAADALQDIATDAERLAPIFAPVAPGTTTRAAELATIQAALRQDGAA